MAELKPSARTFLSGFAQRYARERVERLVGLNVDANGEIEVRFGHAVERVKEGDNHADTFRRVANAIDRLIGGRE